MSNARKAEAKGEKTAVIEWRGHRFEVPREYDDWSVDLIESLEEGKGVGIVRGAIGPEGWREFKATNPKRRDLDDLTDAIVKALGFDEAGESSASSD